MILCTRFVNASIFELHPSLTSIHIGKSVFDGCTGLKNTIVITASVAKVDETAFTCVPISGRLLWRTATRLSEQMRSTPAESTCIQTKFFTYNDMAVGWNVHCEYFWLAASILTFGRSSL